jgi:hypothetical protein
MVERIRNSYPLSIKSNEWESSPRIMVTRKLIGMQKSE